MISIILFTASLACAVEEDATPAVNKVAPDSSEAVEIADTEEKPSETRRPAISITEIPSPRIRARHILIAYANATSVDENVTRSMDAARTFAEQLQQELDAGKDFESLAKAHSNDGTGRRGGDLGVFTIGVMNKAFEEATLALKVGERSAIVETPFGFHIIERLEVVEVHVAHILIQWEGLKRTTSERPQTEANERAQSALAELNTGSLFADVAQKYSDGPAGSRGGDLGWFQKGQMVPQFDNAAFSLKAGQTSDIVESSYGYHIIRRIE
jgi:parvulin-like peptidyl-prolyl isomerase